jgi:proliferating cell nuclear antigen
MFECTLPNGELFKKIVAALSDLVEQGNFMVDSNMISFQGMDSSHVSLVALQLTESGFEAWRCDHDLCLGIQFASLNKILKCMTSKDSLSIQARDDGDIVNFIFESQDQKRFSNFELKLNDIDQEQLGIPDTVYASTVKMPSSEFQRICRDLAAIGDTVTISATKDGVKFSVTGDIGSGDMTIKGLLNAPSKTKTTKTEKGDANKNKSNKVKQEPGVTAGNDDETQMDEDHDEDEDMKGNDEEPSNANGEEEEAEEQPDNAPTGNVDDDGDLENAVIINLEESVTQTFSLRYLNNFTKATGLCDKVTLRMGADVPLEVEYKIGDFGSLRYYLAPKIDDED